MTERRNMRDRNRKWKGGGGGGAKGVGGRRHRLAERRGEREVQGKEG